MSDIQMKSVASSNVESIGYDINTQTLRIKFLNGSVYEYKNVPQVEFEQLDSAPSVGSYLNRNIKNNYPFTKVE